MASVAVSLLDSGTIKVISIDQDKLDVFHLLIHMKAI